MDNLIKHPLIVLALSFFLLWLSAKIGLFVRKRQLKLQKDLHQDLDIETRDENALLQIDATTAQLQTELWSAVRTPAGAQPTPVLALAVSGMNDVWNSQGYTQAAWWNRIPPGAWFLMATVAFCSNVLHRVLRHSGH
jgi:hypothetical protein